MPTPLTHHRLQQLPTPLRARALGRLTNRRRPVLAVAASGLLAGLLAGPFAASTAQAQTAPFPSKPIKLVVGFSAGGVQ